MNSPLVSGLRATRTIDVSQNRPPVVVALFGILIATSLGSLTPLLGPALVLACAVATALILAVIGSTRLAMSCLLVLLVGLLAFSRTFAVIGKSPVFLPELLLVVAAVSSRRSWWPIHPSLRSFAVIGSLLFALNVQAVIRGIEYGYPTAAKGMTMGFWPLAAVIVSALLTRRPDLHSKLPYLLILVAPGLVATVALGIEIVASAFGLSLAVAAGFAASPQGRARTVLAIGAVVGTMLLTVIGDKRGPLLAIVIAVVLVRLASRSNAKWHGSWSFVLGLSFLFAFGIANLNAQSGSLVSSDVIRRVQSSGDLSTEAGRNVDIRFEMWKYAIRTTVHESPFFGTGAGRPLSFVYGNNDLSQQDSGPHNSFVGYAYYSGFPSAALVLACFWMAARRALACRKTHPGAAPLLGALGAVFVTSLTNVVFETTYIGSIGWLIIGAAMSLMVPPPLAKTGAVSLSA